MVFLGTGPDSYQDGLSRNWFVLVFLSIGSKNGFSKKKLIDIGFFVPDLSGWSFTRIGKFSLDGFFE